VTVFALPNFSFITVYANADRIRPKCRSNANVNKTSKLLMSFAFAHTPLPTVIKVVGAMGMYLKKYAMNAISHAESALPLASTAPASKPAFI